MSQITLPRRRLSTMIQINTISYNPHHHATGLLQPRAGVRRAPTIDAPAIMLAPEPTASLKRRSHIRRTSRSPTSPQSVQFFSEAAVPRPQKPQLAPLTTAFTRSVTASSASGSTVTRQPTLIDHSAVEWRDAPRRQAQITLKADISRRSTIASVYSMPSAGPHVSRQSTQENYIQDWSVVDRMLQNRTQSPVTHSPHSQSPRDYAPRPSPTSQDRAHRTSVRSQSTTADLSRSNTTQVRSMIMNRQRRSDVVSRVVYE